jgi:hypothetical protein
MAAGLGFKDFVTGEVLTAADVDGYLMQGIWVFASATARDAAVTSPQEGNFAYLKDTNTTTYYTGSAWTNLDTTGMVNPMTTTGDTIYSSSGSTPARLGIGSTGQVLTVSGGVPTWASPAGGGKLLQVVAATSSTSTSVASTTPTDTTLTATITPTSASSTILVLVTQHFRKIRTSGIQGVGLYLLRGATTIWNGTDQLSWHNFAGVTEIQFDDIFSVSYVDSPSTTSATTYKTQGDVWSTANGGSVTFQDNSRVSTITLLEIGA